MRPELERLQQIEQYLLHHRSPEQVAEWRVQELLDADLGLDTDAQRLTYQGIRTAGRQQLRQELTAIHQQLYGPRRRNRLSAFAHLLAGLGFRVRAWLLARTA